MVKASIISMAIEFTKEGIAYLVAGKPQRTKKEQTRCWEICEKCIYLTKSKRCSKCGCSMLHKIQWATTKCKIGKW